MRAALGIDAVRAAVDPAALAADLASIVQVPSLTGQERAVLERLAGVAERLGLDVEIHEHDLAELRAAEGYPGEEAPRDELLSLTARLPATAGGPRLCLNGHVDVVSPGTGAWARDPWSGEIAGGAVHGRGSVDMKGGVVAALHALGALRATGAPTGEVVLQAVPSEEDGGLGTFAELERDDRFEACLIPEPTNLALVCAQAGALTFRGTVRGTSAHAAFRLEGVSAIDRYVPLHQALHEHERDINREVEHPLMRALPLPYPVLVGRLEAGTWSAQVPDRLVFEGRVGVRVGESVEAARAATERALRAAEDGGPPLELAWTGGQFASGETPLDHPWVARVRQAAEAELGRAVPLAGVPYGADMRLFSARGIPCVMFGSRGVERAHAVDEQVLVDDLVAVARTAARTILASRA